MKQIRPELLDKFRKVKDMQDFVRLFKPEGFTLREEPVLRPQKNRGKSNVFSWMVQLNSLIVLLALSRFTAVFIKGRNVGTEGVQLEGPLSFRNGQYPSISN